MESTQPLTEMSTRSISWGQRRPVRKADNLTTILCRCHEISETTSWNPLGHSSPVTGLLYLFAKTEWHRNMFMNNEYEGILKVAIFTFCKVKSTVINCKECDRSQNIWTADNQAKIWSRFFSDICLGCYRYTTIFGHADVTQIYFTYCNIIDLQCQLF